MKSLREKMLKKREHLFMADFLEVFYKDLPEWEGKPVNDPKELLKLAEKYRAAAAVLG